MHFTAGKRKHLEHQGWINTTKESIDYIKSHPDIYYNFLQHQKVIGNAEKNKNISKINKVMFVFKVICIHKHFHYHDTCNTLNTI